MTEAEIEHFIEQTLAALPERMSGNEANRIVEAKLQKFLSSHRDTIVQCLQKYLSFRSEERQRTAADAVQEARIWLVLDVGERLGLKEL